MHVLVIFIACTWSDDQSSSLLVAYLTVESSHFIIQALGCIIIYQLMLSVVSSGGAPLSARPPVQREFSWPDGESVIVGLSLHATAQPYAIPCEAMQRSVRAFL